MSINRMSPDLIFAQDYEEPAISMSLPSPTDQKTQSVFSKAIQQIKNCFTSIGNFFSQIGTNCKFFYNNPDLILPGIYLSIFGSAYRNTPPPSVYGSFDEKDARWSQMSFASDVYPGHAPAAPCAFIQPNGIERVKRDSFQDQTMEPVEEFADTEPLEYAEALEYPAAEAEQLVEIDL